MDHTHSNEDTSSCDNDNSEHISCEEPQHTNTPRSAGSDGHSDAEINSPDRGSGRHSDVESNIPHRGNDGHSDADSNIPDRGSGRHSDVESNISDRGSGRHSDLESNISDRGSGRHSDLESNISDQGGDHQMSVDNGNDFNNNCTPARSASGSSLSDNHRLAIDLSNCHQRQRCLNDIIPALLKAPVKKYTLKHNVNKMNKNKARPNSGRNLFGPDEDENEILSSRPLVCVPRPSMNFSSKHYSANNVNADNRHSSGDSDNGTDTLTDTADEDGSSEEEFANRISNQEFSRRHAVVTLHLSPVANDVRNNNRDLAEDDSDVEMARPRLLPKHYVAPRKQRRLPLSSRTRLQSMRRRRLSFNHCDDQSNTQQLVSEGANFLPLAAETSNLNLLCLNPKLSKQGSRKLPFDNDNDPLGTSFYKIALPRNRNSGLSNHVDNAIIQSFNGLSNHVDNAIIQSFNGLLNPSDSDSDGSRQTSSRRTSCSDGNEHLPSSDEDCSDGNDRSDTGSSEEEYLRRPTTGTAYMLPKSQLFAFASEVRRQPLSSAASTDSDHLGNCAAEVSDANNDSNTLHNSRGEDCNNVNDSSEVECADLTSNEELSRRHAAVTRPLSSVANDGRSKPEGLVTDDSDAECDRPRLLPEHYVAPRRQRRIPRSQEERFALMSRKQLLFDDSDDENNNQKAIYEDTRLVTQSDTSMPMSPITNNDNISLGDLAEVDSDEEYGRPRFRPEHCAAPRRQRRHPRSQEERFALLSRRQLCFHDSDSGSNNQQGISEDTSLVPQSAISVPVSPVTNNIGLRDLTEGDSDAEYERPRFRPEHCAAPRRQRRHPRPQEERFALLSRRQLCFHGSDSGSNNQQGMSEDTTLVPETDISGSVSPVTNEDTIILRDLSEDDSDAEYDRPRLLPEHYVAPRRQRRFPFSSRAEIALMSRKQLLFDDIDDENNNQKELYEDTSLVTQSDTSMPVSPITNNDNISLEELAEVDSDEYGRPRFRPEHCAAPRRQRRHPRSQEQRLAVVSRRRLCLEGCGDENNNQKMMSEDASLVPQSAISGPVSPVTNEDSICLRDLAEGDSDAEYDRPLLLPEHYVAPRRQRRFPFSSRAEIALMSRKQLLFDDSDDENNNQKMMSEDASLVPQSAISGPVSPVTNNNGLRDLTEGDSDAEYQRPRFRPEHCDAPRRQRRIPRSQEERFALLSRRQLCFHDSDSESNNQQGISEDTSLVPQADIGGPVSSVTDSISLRDLAEGDSDAEYDRPLLLPEHYVAPRRQRRHPCSQGGRLAPLTRRQLCYENCHDENNVQKSMSEDTGLVPHSDISGSVSPVTNENSIVLRDLAEDDSDAEYDRPRLLPKHYVAPRRQRRFPFSSRAEIALMSRKQLLFDDSDSESNNQQGISEDTSLVPQADISGPVSPVTINIDLRDLTEGNSDAEYERPRFRPEHCAAPRRQRRIPFSQEERPALSSRRQLCYEDCADKRNNQKMMSEDTTLVPESDISVPVSPVTNNNIGLRDLAESDSEAEYERPRFCPEHCAAPRRQRRPPLSQEERLALLSRRQLCYEDCADKNNNHKMMSEDKHRVSQSDTTESLSPVTNEDRIGLRDLAEGDSDVEYDRPRYRPEHCAAPRRERRLPFSQGERRALLSRRQLCFHGSDDESNNQQGISEDTCLVPQSDISVPVSPVTNNDNIGHRELAEGDSDAEYERPRFRPEHCAAPRRQRRCPLSKEKRLALLSRRQLCYEDCDGDNNNQKSMSEDSRLVPQSDIRGTMSQVTNDDSIDLRGLAEGDSDAEDERPRFGREHCAAPRRQRRSPFCYGDRLALVSRRELCFDGCDDESDNQQGISEDTSLVPQSDISGPVSPATDNDSIGLRDLAEGDSDAECDRSRFRPEICFFFFFFLFCLLSHNGE